MKKNIVFDESYTRTGMLLRLLLEQPMNKKIKLKSLISDCSMLYITAIDRRFNLTVLED